MSTAEVAGSPDDPESEGEVVCLKLWANPWDIAGAMLCGRDEDLEWPCSCRVNAAGDGLPVQHARRRASQPTGARDRRQTGSGWAFLQASAERATSGHLKERGVADWRLNTTRLARLCWACKAAVLDDPPRRPTPQNHDVVYLILPPSTSTPVLSLATMAAIFRDFSFGPASRHPSSFHEAERAAMNVSPTSTPLAPPLYPARLPTPPPCSIGELAQRFNQQSLRVDTSSSYRIPTFYELPLTPPSDDFVFPADAPQQSPYSFPSPVALRQQRQANMRMQCSPSHIRDISILVQRMVEEGDQCHICDSKSRTSPSPSPFPSPPSSNSSNADEDEGVDMEYSPLAPKDSPLSTLKFRRSGDRLNGQAMVAKTVRMRKKSKVMKRSSK
ncbi:uncharacterized protein BDR25DRAFT_339930 [Lindgomyces ingoldianus]|uniref:Uncharacterized protein n=1 Tax=Lindgomyces ingoldianus TaxID=673940 RepID=A0ACB6RCK6_9PLEO|nr:uncharacterized protein BDR25DRAFT_339930 [Lindgomyces ingoldianus]KAF2476062.1 hypothetical protein BDR25DRAFT_339930 [Lindgomyces ingoldianus]